MSKYKVEKTKIVSWKSAHLGRGRDETPNVESTKETRLLVDMIPDQELQEDEAVQPQNSRSTKLVPSGSSYEDTNILSDQSQQSGDIEIV